MLQRVGIKFEEWLLPRSRILLSGLIAANICVAFALIAFQEEPPVKQTALAPIESQIQLLAEVPAALPVDKPLPKECRVWGPEQSPSAFDDLLADLDAQGGFPEVKKTEVQGDPDFLVYIGELGSRENAKRVARELNSLDMESYLMIREDDTPILSVGLFSRQPLANKQLNRVTTLGYAGFIEELPRAQTVYSLTAHVQADSQLYKTSTSPCMAIAQNP